DVAGLEACLAERERARVEAEQARAAPVAQAPALEAAEREAREAAQALSTLLASAQVGSREAFVALAQHQAEAHELRAREREALAALAGKGLSVTDGLVAELQDLRGDESGAAEASAADAARALETGLQELAALEQQLKGWREAAGEAALLERRAALSATAQRLAARAATLLLARQALEAVRERLEPQSELLREAALAFRTMSDGRYVSLRENAAAKEVHAITADGRELPATQLSRGTREQLLLAFRFAGARLYAQRHLAVPMLLDDVLVHADAARLSASAKALAELAQVTQVLFFTCHRHVREELEGVGAKAVHVSSATQLALLAQGDLEGANARADEP
ncbi:MAG: hypothetical protein K1X89_29710, partial [Myxococcaceae bacterium]|nr:hypothetical protein [Myxococcaceae bacterium]